MIADGQDSLASSFWRFLVGGAINTGLTYVLFLLLDRVLHHSLAYTLAYLAGIALAYVLATTYVFRTGIELRSALRFPGVYVLQYFYGLAALSLLVDIVRMPSALAMLVMIATSVPLTFLLTRFAVRQRQDVRSSAHE
jgi:putative flippase GtrA